MSKKKWFGTWPADCDICHTDLTKTKTFTDGVTRNGRWALMCPICFALEGRGLGPGRGQQYDSLTREKLGG